MTARGKKTHATNSASTAQRNARRAVFSVMGLIFALLGVRVNTEGKTKG